MQIPALMRGFKPWSIFIALLVLILCAAYLLGGSDSTDEEEGMDLPLVSAEVVRRQDLSIFYHALGTVTAFNTVTVRSQVDGALMKVLFQEGQQVSQGALLAVVDPRPYQAALQQAQGGVQETQAQLRNAEIDLARYQGLFAEDSIARQTLDTQEALVAQYRGTLQTNRAAVAQAQINLEFCEIRAPITGRLGLRQLDVGNLVHSSESTPLVVITQTQPIHVQFSLPEQQSVRIREHLTEQKPLAVEAYTANAQTLLATGVLASVDNQIDSATGTLKFKALFENTKEALFPNQFVTVRLLAERLDKVLAVPEYAVQPGQQESFVYVVTTEGMINRRSVVLGASDGALVQILSGLSEGERVVSEGVDDLRDGMEVEVAEPSAQTQSSLAEPASDAVEAGA